jgi:hypothetical protein
MISFFFSCDFQNIEALCHQALLNIRQWFPFRKTKVLCCCVLPRGVRRLNIGEIIFIFLRIMEAPGTLTKIKKAYKKLPKSFPLPEYR